MKHPHTIFLAEGAYTLPDAAQLLGIPLTRLRLWVGGVLWQGDDSEKSRHYTAGKFHTKGEGRDKHLNFFTLIELFTIAKLREYGVSMATARRARNELAKRFETPYPFALRGLLTGGKKLLKELGNEVLLELDTDGQTAFASVLKPFCHQLDFDSSTQLASRFYPEGRESVVVVDPRHAFGRPVIVGTNITTECLGQLLRGGENAEEIAQDFRLDISKVNEAWRFEQKRAA